MTAFVLVGAACFAVGLVAGVVVQWRHQADELEDAFREAEEAREQQRLLAEELRGSQANAGEWQARALVAENELDALRDAL